MSKFSTKAGENVTLSSTLCKMPPYNGNGSTTQFPFTFSIDDLDDIKVDLTDSNGNVTRLTTGYEVVPNDPLDYSVGGHVTYPSVGTIPNLASGEKLTIIRQTPMTQESEYNNQGGLNKKALEASLDKLTMMAQEYSDRMNKSIIISNPAENIDYLFPEPVADKVLGWNSDGTGFVNLDNPVASQNAAAESAESASGSAEDAAESAAAALVSETNVNNMLHNGWISIEETCVYASADDPVFIMNISADMTEILSEGNRFRCSQVTGGQKDFIILNVGEYTGGVTPVTIFGGSGTGSVNLNDETISDPHFSIMKSPAGFNLNPLKWQIAISDVNNQASLAVASGTWVNPGNLSITLPKGLWYVGYSVLAYSKRTSTGATENVSVTLSTANNNEINKSFTNTSTVAGLSSAQNMDFYQTFSKGCVLVVASKTIYYLNIKSAYDGDLRFRGDSIPTEITAISAYL